MHKFWIIWRREKFFIFKNCSVVPRLIMNLSQLKESHSNISYFFRSRNLYLVRRIYGMEGFEDSVSVLYANLYLSQENSELETLMLGTKIILMTFYLRNFWTLSSLGLFPLGMVHGLITLSLELMKVRRFF